MALEHDQNYHTEQRVSTRNDKCLKGIYPLSVKIIGMIGNSTELDELYTQFHISDFLFGPLSAVTHFYFPDIPIQLSVFVVFTLSTRNVLALKNSQRCKMKKGAVNSPRNFEFQILGIKPVPAACRP